jgi:hypothetical protein
MHDDMIPLFVQLLNTLDRYIQLKSTDGKPERQELRKRLEELIKAIREE